MTQAYCERRDFPVPRRWLYAGSDCGEFDEPELVCQMGVDVITDTPYLPRRQTAAVRDWRSLRRTVTVQQRHSQHGDQPLKIKASARVTPAQFAPSKSTESSDHRVLDAD